MRHDAAHHVLEAFEARKAELKREGALAPRTAPSDPDVCAFCKPVQAAFGRDRRRHLDDPRGKDEGPERQDPRLLRAAFRGAAAGKDDARPLAVAGLLFGNDCGSVLSDVALTRPLKAAKLEAPPHGFRSSLRNWLAEATDAPHEVAEAMLAHVTDNEVVFAYRRTGFLEQRRALMELWAVQVTGGTGKLLKLAPPAPHLP